MVGNILKWKETKATNGATRSGSKAFILYINV
jgi:hypothetical protein